MKSALPMDADITVAIVDDDNLPMMTWGYVSSNPPSESTKNLLLDLIKTEPAFFFSADDDFRLCILDDDNWGVGWLRK